MDVLQILFSSPLAGTPIQTYKGGLLEFKTVINCLEILSTFIPYRFYCGAWRI